MNWERHKAFFSNTAFIVGRMYRYFLRDEKAKVTMLAYEEDKLLASQNILPNDPLYLMKNTQSPKPFDKKAAFEQFGDDVVERFEYKGKTHEVTIKSSICKQEYRRKLALEGKNLGDTPLGKQCAKNQGISIIRAGRQLEMNSSFENTYEPTERFWGVEVSFEPDADDIFGVSNNKQAANNFKRLDKKILAEQEDVEVDDLNDFLKNQEDIRLPILNISNIIAGKLTAIRKQLDVQTKGVKAAKSADKNDRAKQIADKNVSKDGSEGASDKIAESLTEKEVRDELDKEYEKTGYGTSEEDKNKIISDWLDSKFIFASEELKGGYSIFDVSHPGGKIKISFNSKHPAYEQFIKKIEEEDSFAFDALKLLFAAWARIEDVDEAQNEERKKTLEKFRYHWGCKAQEMLDEYVK